MLIDNEAESVEMGEVTEDEAKPARGMPSSSAKSAPGESVEEGEGAKLDEATLVDATTARLTLSEAAGAASVLEEIGAAAVVVEKTDA